jgi:capsular exopolysaccharide synthesis family protein
MRNILITSAQTLEGKTTTALGLAFTAALLKPNKRILLVDMDLRNSDIHHMLGLKESPGLREMFCGLSKDKDCFHATRFSNLMVIPSGKQAVDMPDIFQDEALAQLFKGITERFDLVFYDSPPIKDHLDALYLGSIADAVLMVVHPKISRTDLVMHARDEIRQAGGKIVGTILNAFRNPIPSFFARHL